MITLIDIFERPKQEKNKTIKKNKKMIITPKEKAIELINNFSRTHVIGILNTKGKLVSPYSSGYASIEVRNIRAKNSALISVDEILQIDCCDMSEKNFNNHIEYWISVQKEIKNYANNNQ